MTAPSVHVVQAGTIAKLEDEFSESRMLVIVAGPLPVLVSVVVNGGAVVVPGNWANETLVMEITPWFTPAP